MALPADRAEGLSYVHMRIGTAILLTAVLIAVVVSVTLQLFVNR